MLQKFVSGGQTGVDRAALDAARRLRLSQGGWCPRGRRAEDGPIPSWYPLRETPSRSYDQRTRWNVRDSDGTLIINRGPLDGGTLLTFALARKTFAKPVYVQQVERRLDRRRFRVWLRRKRIRILNVAGPRESKRPGIYKQAAEVILGLLWQRARRPVKAPG